MSIPPRRLLLLAAVLHISLTIGITILGKSRVVSSTFDTNGVGISFGIDSVSYRAEALKMASLLREGRVREWMNYTAPLATFHSRLYSICYVVFGWVLGDGVLAIEPINLLYYLSILVLTYFIGVVAFSPVVGRLAAVVVGLWPSLLIFTTQLLRDPLFIFAFLLLLFSLVVCIKRPISFKQAFAVSGAGVAALLLILLGRATMWEVVVAIVMLGAIFCVAAQLVARSLDIRKTIVIVLICLAAFMLPKIVTVDLVTDRAERAMALRDSEPKTNVAPWTRVSRQIGWTRHLFITRYASAGSNMDTDVELRSLTDLIRYLPRAAQIGFLAPFPSMWFTKGVEVGLTGRLVIGAEMLGLYCLLLLALVTLIYARKQLVVWLLFSAAVLGCVTLAYVVVNASALYRLRYPYFIPIILLAAQGFCYRTGAKRPSGELKHKANNLPQPNLQITT